MMVYKDTRNLMPDSIEGLKETYECITTVLNDVTRTKESNEDRNAKVKSVIIGDIEQLINLIAARKVLMKHGERVCVIEEINNLIRRIDPPGKTTLISALATKNGLDSKRVNF